MNLKMLGCVNMWGHIFTLNEALELELLEQDSNLNVEVYENYISEHFYNEYQIISQSINHWYSVRKFRDNIYILISCGVYCKEFFYALINKFLLILKTEKSHEKTKLIFFCLEDCKKRLENLKEEKLCSYVPFDLNNMISSYPSIIDAKLPQKDLVLMTYFIEDLAVLNCKFELINEFKFYSFTTESDGLTQYFVLINNPEVLCIQELFYKTSFIISPINNFYLQTLDCEVTAKELFL